MKGVVRGVTRPRWNVVRGGERGGEGCDTVRGGMRGGSCALGLTVTPRKHRYINVLDVRYNKTNKKTRKQENKKDLVSFLAVGGTFAISDGSVPIH